MDLTKDIRLLVFVGLVFLALASLVYPMIFKKHGVIVVHILEGSPCEDSITEGSVIREVAGRSIKNSNDFYGAIKNLEGITTFLVNNNPRSCEIPPGSVLNITVKDMKRRGLKLGIDVQGGTEILLKPDEDVSETVLQQVFDMLRSRAKRYGLTNIRMERSGNDSIRVFFDPEDEINMRRIIKQGVFEAKFTQTVDLRNKTGRLVVNDKPYEVSLKGDESVVINGSEYKTDQTFIIEGLKIEIGNITGNTTVFSVNVFDDEDVIDVLTGKDYSLIFEQQGGYVFRFEIQVSEEGSENFAKATNGQEVMVSPTGEIYLKDPLVIFVDDELIMSLPIAQRDAGKEITSMVIWGFERTREEASDKMVRLVSILETKRLPVKVDIVRIDQVSPPRKSFVISLVYATLVGLLFMPVAAFIRYKKLEIVLVIVSTIISEIILTLGVASSQVFAIIVLLCGVGLAVMKGEIHGQLRWVTMAFMFLIGFWAVANEWVFGIPSVVGLVMLLYISIIHSIIMSENLIRKEDAFFLKGYESGLGILWKSAFVVVVTMTPLFFLVSALKGFTVAIMIGTMVSVTITKPVYASMIERMNA